MKNWKIGTRLGLGFAVVLLLLAATSGVGVLRLQSVGNATDDMVRGALVKERLASEWAKLLGAAIVQTFAMAKATEPGTEAHFAKARLETSQRINPVQKKLEELLSAPEEKKLYGQVAEARKVVLETLARSSSSRPAVMRQAPTSWPTPASPPRSASMKRRCPGLRPTSASRSMRPLPALRGTTMAGAC